MRKRGNENMVMAQKKGGPYTKQELEKRRNEVYRLHFEYGYSARKIAELMDINRNTINSDINHWYSKIADNRNIFDPETILYTTTERLDIQRTRLRQYLDNASTISEKMTIEKMIFDIDSRLANIHQRLAESSKRVFDVGISFVNEYLKKNNHKERYITYGDRLRVSQKGQESIEKIIQEDKKKLWSKQN